MRLVQFSTTVSLVGAWPRWLWVLGGVLVCPTVSVVLARLRTV